ncbi:hypothetical protein J4405_04090 [Candidatus Woesearchaeota archaeon]|nr:hypothetical protein [Candidatus Woesearchaeota archaeon]
MEFLARGKRSEVYLDENKVVKITNEYSASNEANWLVKLNKYGIGPRFYGKEENKVIMEYVKGIRIIDYLTKESKKKCEKVLKECFKQCEILDKLKVNKKELTNPYKHIIVRNDKPVFIDFERCKITERVKNVNQFKQFLNSLKIKELLHKKGVNLEKLLTD